MIGGERSTRDGIADLQRARADLVIRAGGAVSAADSATRLGGIAVEVVEQRRTQGELLAVLLEGEHRYPRFQFDNAAVLAGLPAVLQAFSVRNGWTQLSALLSPQDALDGRTVIDALAHGDVDAAIGVAAGYGETGA